MSRTKNMANAVNAVFAKFGFFKPGFVVVYSQAPDYKRIGYFGNLDAKQASAALEVCLSDIEKEATLALLKQEEPKPAEPMDDTINGKPKPKKGGNLKKL